jgi:hypothetical protein
MNATASNQKRLVIVGATGTAALFWRSHSSIALSSDDTLVLADINNQTGDAALGGGQRKLLAW